MRKLLGAFFHHLYHGLAWGYDLVAFVVSGGNWIDWTKEIISFLPEGRILEIGFGSGHLLAELSRKLPQVIGLDESWQMNLLAFRNHPGISTVRSLAQYTPFISNGFDAIATTFPAPYIFSQATAEEMFRLLSPGGVLVILLAARPNQNTLLGRFARVLFSITGQTPRDPLDYQQLFSAFSACGLIVHHESHCSKTAELTFVFAEKPQSSAVLNEY